LTYYTSFVTTGEAKQYQKITPIYRGKIKITGKNAKIHPHSNPDLSGNIFEF